MEVKRLDSFKIGKFERDERGYLIAEAVTNKVGIQFYDNIAEFRPPGEVFSTDTLKSMENLPITDDHPWEFVSESAPYLVKGMTVDKTYQDGELAKTKIVIFDGNLIETILKGKIELSLGYTTILKKENGEYDGVKYDYIQTNIIANHLAVVENGRCGGDCKIILDSKDKNLEKKENDNSELVTRLDSVIKEKNELQIKLDSLESEKKVLIELKNEAIAKMTEATAKFDSQILKTDMLEKELEVLKYDSFVKEITSLKANIKIEKNDTINDLKMKFIGEINQNVLSDLKARLDGKDDLYKNIAIDSAYNICKNLATDTTFKLKIDSNEDKPNLREEMKKRKDELFRKDR